MPIHPMPINHIPINKIRSAAIALVLTVAPAAAACGDDDDGSAGAEPAATQIAVTPTTEQPTAPTPTATPLDLDQVAAAFVLPDELGSGYLRSEPTEVERAGRAQYPAIVADLAPCAEVLDYVALPSEHGTTFRRPAAATETTVVELFMPDDPDQVLALTVERDADIVACTQAGFAALVPDMSFELAGEAPLPDLPVDAHGARWHVVSPSLGIESDIVLVTMVSGAVLASINIIAPTSDDEIGAITTTVAQALVTATNSA